MDEYSITIYLSKNLTRGKNSSVMLLAEMTHISVKSGIGRRVAVGRTYQTPPNAANSSLTAICRRRRRRRQNILPAISHVNFGFGIAAWRGVTGGKNHLCNTSAAPPLRRKEAW